MDLSGVRVGRPAVAGRGNHLNVERILFIRTDRMGDVLMNLPAVHLLRQAYPKSWITLALDRSLDGLLNGHPDLDEVMLIDAAKLRKNGAARMEFCRSLRCAAFNLAVVSNPEKWTHFSVFWAGIPVRVGWRRKWGWLLTRSLKDKKAISDRHEIDSNLELAGLVTDKKWDGTLALSADEDAKNLMDGLLAKEGIQGDIVAIHPGTSNPAKKWASERFAEVSDHFQKKGFSVALIGGTQEIGTSEDVVRKSSLRPFDLTGRFDLARLKAFLGHPRVKLLISSDSGPVHIAWMQDTPVVALYSKEAEGSDPTRWGPRNAKSRTVHDSMASITAAKVCALAEEILA